MIKIYPATETVFSNNGLIAIQPIKAEIYCDDNLSYYANLEIPLSYKTPGSKTIDYSEHFIQDNIALVGTAWGPQPFRIGNIEKTSLKIKSRAYHVFHDLKRYIAPTYSFMTMVDLTDVVNYILSESGADAKFTVNICAAPIPYMLSLFDMQYDIDYMII